MSGRAERIARELRTQWPRDEQHHYVVVVTKDGFVEFRGPTQPAMQPLVGELLARALNLDLSKFERPKTVIKICGGCDVGIDLPDFEHHASICPQRLGTAPKVPNPNRPDPMSPRTTVE